MIPKKKATSILLLAFSALLIGGSLAALPGGQWSGTIARVSGDDVALAGVSEHFRLAGGVTELVPGRSLSAQDLAPGSAVTLRIGEREADGRFCVDAMLVQPKNPLTLEGRITGVGGDGRSVSVLGVCPRRRGGRRNTDGDSDPKGRRGRRQRRGRLRAWRRLRRRRRRRPLRPSLTQPPPGGPGRRRLFFSFSATKAWRRSRSWRSAAGALFPERGRARRTRPRRSPLRSPARG